MTTVLEEWDMKCPACNADDRLIISAIVNVILTPEGTTDHFEGQCDHEWDNDCSCTCGNCGFSGTVKHFQAEHLRLA